MRKYPRLIDNDRGEITIDLDGKELRGFIYANDTERRAKMLAAHEYVEGYGDGQDGVAGALGTEERGNALIAASCDRGSVVSSMWGAVHARQLATMLRKEPDRAMNPRVTDNDKDEITVSLDGRELRGWSYASDDERRRKMLQARKYVEGWCDGRDGARP